MEYDKSTVRRGPEFKCSVCGKWFTRLLYWLDKKFNPSQSYKLMFLCGPKCATENYGKSRIK